MTPAARLAAVIELTKMVQEDQVKPADALLSYYFHQRRYMGAKDKRAITEGFYAIIRHQGILEWWLKASGWRWHRARGLVLAYLILICEMLETDVHALFNGNDRFRPESLIREELYWLSEVVRSPIELHRAPLWARLNYPEWLHPYLVRRFGAALASQTEALNRQAFFDLRVNTLKTTRDEVLEKMKQMGALGVATSYAPTGIRLDHRQPRFQLDVFGKGALEVQDEGSQLVALLTGVKPGQRVLDFCAGAGGKTLALAAQMQNKGSIVATDTASWRLDRAGERLRRAGVHNVERRVLDIENDKWLQRQKGKFDRVLVDAPCTGTGTWRRNPDLKWKITEKGLLETLAVQKTILEKAATTVKPGGRLIYATCSLLCEENEDQVAWFTKAFRLFNLVPMEQIWHEEIGTPYPFDDAVMMRTTPADHHMDGFFVAVFECKAEKEEGGH